MKKFFLYIAAITLGAMTWSCSSSDDSGYANELAGLTQIVTLTEGIGDWDEAFLTPQGYFCYAEDVMASTKAEELSDGQSMLYFLNDAEDRTSASILMQKNTHLPVQMVLEGGKAEFCFLSDDVVEVVWSTADASTLVASKTYDKAALAAAANGRYNNNLQKVLSYYCTLLEGSDLSGFPVLQTLFDRFRGVVGVDYDPNVRTTDLNLGKGGNGNYNFVEEADVFTEEVVKKVYYNISLWTGDASFKVGGSSCTLGGAIYCTSPLFRELGEYGVVIDTNIDNLTADGAEFVKLAQQGPGQLSYEVDFRGFKPNTTYYYRSFYRFTGNDHGPLTFLKGDPYAQVGYDTTIKSFTTGDNKLFVDVVMCIDVTGSMSGIINTVKKNATSFYDTFNDRCTTREIELTGMNIQVYAYRDINVDGESAMVNSETYPMPEQKVEFQNFVNNLYASGGGDLPESGLEVLMNAFSKEDFSIDDGYHRQVVILWTDATYLLGEGYTAYTAEMVEAKWNTLPSGRRLILFAPASNWGYSNEGSWDVMDSWVNCMHYTNTGAAFSDITVSIDAIIDELTSGERAALVSANKARAKMPAAKPLN